MQSALCHFVSLVAVALALSGLRPATASACTAVAPLPNLDWGAPLDGATDVPTDVVLLYALPADEVGDEGSVPGAFVLRDESGIDVPFTLRRTHFMAFEIVPDEPLAPNTEYTLQATWQRGADELRFTTGERAVAEAPGPIASALEHYVAKHAASMCDSVTGTCIPLPRDLIVEDVRFDESGKLRYRTFEAGAFSTTALSFEQGTRFECVELRARALNGTFGPKVRMCGDEYPLLHIDGDASELQCTSAGLTQNGKRVAPDANCSAIAVRGGAGQLAPWLLLAAALLWLSYRRKLRASAPLAAIAFGLIGMEPHIASACSTLAPDPNLDWGAPLDGAVDVPTDVVLLYALPVTSPGEVGPVPGTFVLRDQAGRNVAFTLRRTHAMAFEIVPAQPLLPNTTYSLDANWEGTRDALQFTTGEGPLAAAPAAPDGVLEHFVAEREGTSCDPPLTGTCVALAPSPVAPSLPPH